jgi:uncharacterized repeat protein (TIGR01451 family)
LPLLVIAMLLPASAHAATADLAVDKTDSPDPVAVGDVLTYTITVTNLGPDAVGGVTVTDELSQHVTFRAASVTGNNTVTISVRPKKAGEITNTASAAVGAGDSDPSLANNVDQETTTVVAGGGPGGSGDGAGAQGSCEKQGKTITCALGGTLEVGPPAVPGPSGRATCAGKTVTISGTSGPDTLRGGPGRDVIKAFGGADQIRGVGGNDIVCAGGGKDTIKGGFGNDRLRGGSGRDTLKGGKGNDDLHGGPGRDTCRGGPGRDTKRSC